jgi:hypothetical protein
MFTKVFKIISKISGHSYYLYACVVDMVYISLVCLFLFGAVV